MESMSTWEPNSYQGIVFVKILFDTCTLRWDAFAIWSLYIYIQLFIENIASTYRVFKAIGCKLFCLLLLNYNPIGVGNPGSS